MEENYLSNFQGALLGLAVGDALGSVVAGKSRRAIRTKYQTAFSEFEYRSAWVADSSGRQKSVRLAPGTYTNHTAQALIHAISIVQTSGRVDQTDFGPQFVTALAEQQGLDLAPTAYQALLQAQKTGDYQSGLDTPDGADNSVAARIAPIGLLHVYGQLFKNDFLRDCEVAARITHGNPLAVQGGVAMAAAVRLLCRRELMPEDLMSAALDFLPSDNIFDNALRAKLIAAQDYMEERQTLVNNIQANDDMLIDLFDIDLNNMERIGTSNQVADSVAAAFYAFVARKANFEEAITLAVNAGGDSNAIGAMVGALAGAYWGVEAIPARWLEKLQNRTLIERIARALHLTAMSRE